MTEGKITGLTTKEAEESRARYGSNALTPQEVESFWDKLIGNFKDPMIVILVIALFIVLGLWLFGKATGQEYAKWYEGIGIAFAVAIATLVATASEHKNEQTFQKLQEEASKIQVNVFRDGEVKSLNIDDIVVSDKILLHPGDMIPADGILISGTLKVDQSTFTGEADPCTKTAETAPQKSDYDIDNPHTVFRGTIVADGDGIMEVHKVGDSTRIGVLARDIAGLRVNVIENGQHKYINLDDVTKGQKILFRARDEEERAVIMDAANKMVGTLNKDFFVEILDNGRLHTIPAAEANLDHIVVLEATSEDQLNILKELAEEVYGDVQGPLKSKLAKLADQIAMFGYIGGTAIAFSFMFKNAVMDNGWQASMILSYLTDWPVLINDIVHSVILAVIIVVVAVPEGLPMMIAIVLSQNMKKLLDSKVLVRQLLGIETAGSLNLLFCDKTGTITKGQLEGVHFFTFEGSDAKGAEFNQFESFDQMPDRLKEILDLSMRGNTSCLINPKSKEQPLCGGNVTERALLRFIGAHNEGDSLCSPFTVKDQLLFSPHRKFRAAVIKSLEGKTFTLVRGAPGRVVSKCESYVDAHGSVHPIGERERDRLMDTVAERSKGGYRIIGFAFAEEALPLEADSIPTGITLAGFLSIRDDLREESLDAVTTLEKAGIRVVMLTGDRTDTAKAIASDVGIFQEDSDSLAIESASMEQLSDTDLQQSLSKLRIVARCLPEDKMRLVRVARDAGLVVGMTGDGVNDGAALSKSSVGFSLGSGTEVAKDASHVVVLDDNISSIVRAVHYGRAIYRNIQKFIVFQLTVNVSAILVAFAGPFLGFDFPLTMVQLLWVNLIMDTLAALAFSGEPPLRQHMEEKPKQRDEHIITPAMWSSILANGLFIAILSFIWLTSDFMRGQFGSQTAFLTGFFSFFVFINNFNKFNARVDGMNLFEHIGENPNFLRVVGIIFLVQIGMVYLGGEVFRTEALSLGQWGIVILLSLSVIPFDLCRKAIFRRSLSREPVYEPQHTGA